MPNKREKSTTLPTVCLTFFYIVTSLIGCQLLLDHDYRAFAKNASGAWHSAAMIALSFALFGCLRWIRSKSGEAAKRLGRACSLAVALLMLAAGLLSFFFFLSQGTSGPSAIPGVFFSVAYGLFWPVLMLYFFSAVPLGRQGLCFGCAVGAGRLIWLFFLPTLGDALPPDMAANHLLHLRRMLAVANLILGCGLAWIFFSGRGRVFTQAAARSVAGNAAWGGSGGTNGNANGSRVARPWVLLGCALLAIILHNATLGAGTGMSYLSPSIFPRMPNLAHVFLVLCAPLAGALLDGLFRGKYWGGLVVSAVISAAVCMTPAVIFTHVAVDPDFAAAVIRPLLAAGRDISTLAVILVTTWIAGMAWGKDAQPAAATIAYCVQIMALLGSWRLGAFLKESPRHDLAVLLFAASFLLLLMYLFAKCRSLPWQLPEADASEEADAAGEAVIAGEADQKFLAFCVNFSLTKRESEILLALLKGTSMEEVCEKMRFTERTFRFHVTGLLKKTGMLNRQRLLPFYLSWNSGAKPAKPEGV